MHLPQIARIRQPRRMQYQAKSIPGNPAGGRAPHMCMLRALAGLGRVSWLCSCCHGRSQWPWHWKPQIAWIELALDHTSSLSESVMGVCRCMLWMGHRLWRVAREGMSRWPRRDRMGLSTALTVQSLRCRCSVPGSKPTQGAILSAIKRSGLKPPETLLSKTEVQNL